ncbi:MAG TPA: ribosome maturation factor RimM [Alphaproteobacteria bacterium]|nr:ribosome maturation factor RimM [Alphaproteobacteria bacterium]
MAGPGERLLLGEIVAPHGVRGLVRVRSYTEAPGAIADYGPLQDEAGAELRLRVVGPAKAGVLAVVEGVGDRDGAEALRGTKLYVERAALPPAEEEEDEYYQADLIGLAVRRADGDALGIVRSVQNFGAGDLLEVVLTDGRRTVLLPFTREVVPQIDLEAGVVTVAPPPGLID